MEIRLTVPVVKSELDAHTTPISGNGGIKRQVVVRVEGYPLACVRVSIERPVRLCT